ncbi:hypothetical protein FF38_13410 [Lucilia cuprina]|uniref:Uncharacterized protein n=1 Tax=Lucilia cuprina TaxID=7375 RepID=A0A0L0CCI9_LUCCU|nr:hypothetical protein FF38_13410 [Lucilia cuprina]
MSEPPPSYDQALEEGSSEVPKSTFCLRIKFQLDSISLTNQQIEETYLSSNKLGFLAKKNPESVHIIQNNNDNCLTPGKPCKQNSNLIILEYHGNDIDELFSVREKYLTEESWGIRISENIHRQNYTIEKKSIYQLKRDPETNSIILKVPFENVRYEIVWAFTYFHMGQANVYYELNIVMKKKDVLGIIWECDDDGAFLRLKIINKPCSMTIKKIDNGETIQEYSDDSIKPNAEVLKMCIKGNELKVLSDLFYRYTLPNYGVKQPMIVDSISRCYCIDTLSIEHMENLNTVKFHGAGDSTIVINAGKFMSQNIPATFISGKKR